MQGLFVRPNEARPEPVIKQISEPNGYIALPTICLFECETIDM